MSEENHNCPKCQSANTYQDGNIWVCPECFNEWTPSSNSLNENADEVNALNYLDSNGTQLQSGDTVATIKDLKVGKDTLKSGTKVKNIRLLDDPVDGHDISCKVVGLGSIYLKCSVVKKIK